ncbi:hypothetical protein LXL04_032401 [Taraxacum kok-saghyz]
MDSQLKDLSSKPQSPTSQPNLDDASDNDDHPLLSPTTTTTTTDDDKSDSSTPQSTSKELEMKYAAYVRHDGLATRTIMNRFTTSPVLMIVSDLDHTMVCELPSQKALLQLDIIRSGAVKWTEIEKLGGKLSSVSSVAEVQLSQYIPTRSTLRLLQQIKFHLFPISGVLGVPNNESRDFIKNVASDKRKPMKLAAEHKIIHLGRFILYILSSATTPVLSTVGPLTEQARSLANITLKIALTAVTNLTSDHNPLLNVNNATGGVLQDSPNSLNLTNPVILKGAVSTASTLSDVTTLAVGYLFILSLIVFYIGVIALIRYTRGEPLTMGGFYGIASIAETIPSLFRFLAAMRHLMRMIKVAFLLVIELGVFPLMCGWWLDICTIRMFGKSISQRVDFFSVSPLASSLIHWVVGIVYMLQISIFVSLLRGLLQLKAPTV